MSPKQKTKGRKKIDWWIAEQAYVLVHEIEHQNPGITRRKAIYKFFDSPKFANLLNDFYEYIRGIERNHRALLSDYQWQGKEEVEEIQKFMLEDVIAKEYLEPTTGEFLTAEDLQTIKSHYKEIETQLKRIPDPKETGDTNTGYSDRAYKCILRMIAQHQEYVDQLKKDGLL